MNERIFYLDQNADLSELISALSSTKADTVLFVLPRKSTLFESIVNLQILRSEAEEKGKELIILTVLAKARKMCEIAGIECHPTLEHWEKKIPGTTIEAKKNTEEDFSHSQSKIRRVPIVVESDEDERGEAPFSNESPAKPVNWRDFLSRPSWEALLALLLFSGGLFFFLSFLAFPGATVEIRPEKRVVETVTNVTLYNSESAQASSFSRRGGILGYPIESVFTKEMNFSTLNKVFQGQNAAGEITIINTYPEAQRLRPTTRFQSPEGLIFRIPDWAVVPAATSSGPGKIVTTVVADETDMYGRFVGEMGNIPPTTFILPGLDEAGQKKLWAESTEPFTGGYTDWIPVIAESDIVAAKNKITADLLASAQEDLQNFIIEKNVREMQDLKLLLGEKFVETEILNIEVEEDILGKEQSSFFISAQLKVRTWAYSENEMYELVWEELSAKTDAKMKLAGIDDESIHMQLVSENNDALKISVSVRGAEEYIIDPRSEAGILFVNDIKSEILGMDKDEAELVLANREEVSEVHISLWPFWNKRIPTLSENISVKLLSAENRDL